MQDQKLIPFLKEVVSHMPSDWIDLTTHRLDIYDERQAKSQFLAHFEKLYQEGVTDTAALSNLPTAYDYIRLGHPLSSILEWAIAKMNTLSPAHIISFSSETAPILSVLRKNALDGKGTTIAFAKALPKSFNADLVRSVYGYHFDTLQVNDPTEIPTSKNTSIYISHNDSLGTLEIPSHVDFKISTFDHLGSILLANTASEDYISDIQHVRRRETIAMTPADSFTALQMLVGESPEIQNKGLAAHKASVEKLVKEITNTTTKPLFGSSGLSVQYAIMMGLVDAAQEQHPGKAIKFIVPPNCYGGTNDQARRVAACLDHVEILDLPVDGDNDMVKSIDTVLDKTAQEDAVPYIIAEIPTNPRVEVPDLTQLRAALSKPRTTPDGNEAIAPVFILDQTFCPNYHFLGEEDILSSVKSIAYASGSKFPSGGKCTAGYCVANDKAASLMPKIETHLHLCDNEATALQYEILAEQLPSMNERIAAAYKNTRSFVDYIASVLPSAKINFVSTALADQGFTPSVFSLNLPTKGETPEEQEAFKRKLNLKLINRMITEIPTESKYCVSYGQLKGVYWTVPATSTQGTTKEGDKDYIVRASLSPEVNLEKHKEIFKAFVNEINTAG